MRLNIQMRLSSGDSEHLDLIQSSAIPQYKIFDMEENEPVMI